MTSSRGWRPWRDDEEMAKKDDDLALPRRSSRLAHAAACWKAARVPRRAWVKRVVVYALVILAMVYLFSRDASSELDPYFEASQGFYKQQFDPDRLAEAANRLSAPSRSRHAAKEKKKTMKTMKHGQKERPGSGVAAPGLGEPQPQPQPQRGADSSPDGDLTKTLPWYNGPVEYPHLAESLGAIRSTGGAMLANRNVLFAAASLKSASSLLPMACEMAKERQNYVHFAFVGKADMALQDLVDINGIGKSCPLILHDARPDNFSISTPYRTSVAVTKAFYFIDAFMHPQAIIIDSSSAEEDYFLAPARDQILATQSALIELPERSRNSLSWISKLDSAALSAWNKPRFDILIYATPNRTGNLKRLLQSISNADLAGIQTPSITIELPHVVDAPLESFLASFQWPRPTPYRGQQPQMISLRRRITRQRLDEEDSSVRFMESFWPTDPSNSHVLVLSPNTEVSTQFFQYVKYSLLHHLHSKTALVNDDQEYLMGLSLSVPPTLIDGTSAFALPSPLGHQQGKPGQTAFLWQRPNSEATIFLGKKWIELHGFVAETLYRRRSMSDPPALLAQKESGKMYPAWLEYALLLARSRGYLTLYPSQPTARAIIGVHSDVPSPPEEYELDAGNRAAAPRTKKSGDEGNKYFEPASPVDTLETLPDNGQLPWPGELPLLAWDGKPKTAGEFREDAQEFRALFRREVGGCGKKEAAGDNDAARRTAAEDLFCEGSSKQG
ncbi:uncharacterized protein UV8b_04427 [Ustilaginoidea virens]|uniref:Glycosyltransferase 2 n=1 Tax=Ustilaginoidea virens TaxID=1159556 RepID=A0A8E5HRG2_USTVR|nr:uncharacterized protein UV8b_04427 [Ustilaginoidea virens]QUC20186.1 hypothetical protein UV8b_04427 [Ustilaginoidea virens]